jgi:hypothetical protein
VEWDWTMNDEMASLQETPPTQPQTRRRRTLLWIVLGLLVLCLTGAGLSALSNRGLPDSIEDSDRLSSLDKARLAEALQLKQTLGDRIWPGLSTTEIPILLWNRTYSFLIGSDISFAPTGWEEVPGDTFLGEPYYRRISNDPQNFAVQVADQWAASIGTKLETDLFIREMIQESLPPPINQIVPYRLLIQPSEVQISAVLHEGFHVFQQADAQARFEDAEMAYQTGPSYWAIDPAMNDAWQEEIETLAAALEAESENETAALVRQFLDQRQSRRQAHSLSPDLLNFERRFEWLEGMAKYVELESWRQAAETDDYHPVPAMAEDPDFDGYANFDGRWSQEIGQMKRQANQEGDTRFYYTGMAQAALLDQLLPGWKDQVMKEGVWLEDLLAQAVK